MQKEYSQPVHFIAEGPQKWQQDVVQRALQQTEVNWQQETNVAPHDTHLTVAMPIYNEKDYLDVALSSVLFSDIPPTAHINFAFITNNCSDVSPEIVQNFIAQYSEVADAEEHDHINAQIQQTDSNAAVSSLGRSGNVTFTHIDTKTPGKGNALTVANTFALHNGDPIAMCTDANNFVAPNAIAKLYGTAYNRMVAEPNNTVIVSGYSEHEVKPTRFQMLEKYQKKRHLENLDRIKHQPNAKVNGQLFAWNTQWVQEVGGVPNVAVEDLALHLLAQHKGYKIEKITEAVTHGFRPNNFRDILSERVRFLRGRLQIKDQYPELTDLVHASEPYAFATPQEKYRMLAKELKGDIRRLPMVLGIALTRAFVEQKAKHEHKLNPHKASWDPIDSTKKIS